MRLEIDNFVSGILLIDDVVLSEHVDGRLDDMPGNVDFCGDNGLISAV
jgi:hypothetical protein